MASGKANAGTGSLAPAADHRQSVSDEEFALQAWLKLHPARAKTYGIHDINGKTRIGSMLRQTLASQGMKEEWYLQVPAGTGGNVGTNEHAARFVKNLSTRPGNRLKGLKERLAELENAAAACGVRSVRLVLGRRTLAGIRACQKGLTTHAIAVSAIGSVPPRDSGVRCLGGLWLGADV
jgi:hypothetical protein